MKILETKEIKDLLKSSELEIDDKLSILKTLSHLVNCNTGYDPEVQELILRTLEQREQFSDFNDILNTLTRAQGLYPYINTEDIGLKDAFAVELHRSSNYYDQVVDGYSDSGYVFHKVQAEVFQKLMNGESVILSAPTSFGKSAIVDALVESRKFRNIAIVVPTIALIDEIRKRLSKYKHTHKVITHASQEQAEANILVLTQERVVDFPVLPELDLFVIDEFYKLNPIADAERAAMLNHAFYRLLKKANQFYLLGPNIQSIPEGFPERFKCSFFRTDFCTVVTEVTRLNPQSDESLETLIDLCRDIEGPTLIFCSSPAKANKIASVLLGAKLQLENFGMPAAADWVGENYDPNWTLARGMRTGIGIHHGRMPRALAQVVVKAFNQERLKFLICTSTLIEGVNTKAKNVVIYDNKIANQKFDFFTFNNIKGRSGRMFEHFIGNVYLFHPEPPMELPFVDIPVYTQDPQNTPTSLLIQMEPNDLEDVSRNRVDQYKSQTLLSMAVLRENIGVEPRDQLKLAIKLRESRHLTSQLAWSGFPNFSQLEELCNVIWDHFVEGSRLGGVMSGRHLATRINQLKSKSIRQLIQAQLARGETPDEAVEGVLDFVRQWPQFRFGRLAKAVNRIQNEIALTLGEPRADYSSYLVQVESLFADPVLSYLDEYGVPFPLAKKLGSLFSTDGNLDMALHKLGNLNIHKLNISDFEKAMLEETKVYL